MDAERNEARNGNCELVEVCVTLHRPPAQNLRRPWPDQEVSIQDGSIWFGISCGIPLDKVATSDAILGCVVDLALRGWMTPKMIGDFVKTSAKYHGITVPPFWG